MTPRILPLLTILLCLAVSGCTEGDAVRSAPSTDPLPGAELTPSTPPIGPLGAPGCDPASPMADGAGFPEIQGTPTEGDASVFGLVMMAGSTDFRVGIDVKIVWRMTGDGDLSAQLFDPDGAPEPLSWGPESHLSSTYTRPGREWGVGLVFDTPGCWELKLSTDTTAASVWMSVTS